MLFRYCDFMGPRLFGLYPNGLFTFGLSPFGLPMTFGLQGHADYRHLDFYDVLTIAIRTILDYKDNLDYNDIWTIAGLL